MKYEKPQILDLSDELFSEGVCNLGPNPTGACKSGTRAQGNCNMGYNPNNGDCVNGPNPKEFCNTGTNKV